MPTPRYILSERAASALRALIAPGSTYSSRRRPIRDAGGGPLPPRGFLECRVFKGGATDPQSGETVDELRVYIGPGGNYPPSLRINGKPAPLAINAGDVDADGWLPLGAADSITAVWLVPSALPVTTSPATYENAPNQAYTISYGFDVLGTTAQPGTQPTGVPDGNWPRWLRPLFVAAVDGGDVRQGIMHGAEITVEVGDADGTHSGSSNPGPGAAGGFCSIEQGDLQQLQLFGFTEPNLVDPTSAAISAAGIDLVVRDAGYTGQQAGSISRARVRYIQLYQLLETLRTIWGNDFNAWFLAHLAEIMAHMADYVTDNQGPFWLTGGSEDTNNGTGIGDENGNLVIDLANSELEGAWATGGELDVGGAAGAAAGAGKLRVRGDAQFDGAVRIGGVLWLNAQLNLDGDISVGGNRLINASGSEIRASKIVTTALDFSGDNYVPANITYLDANGNPQTITVLKKQ